METTSWIKRMLDSRGIAYEERHHRVAFTAQEVAQGEHVTGHRIAKVVIVLADGRPVELILPASRRVVLGRVKELLGAEDVRLASEAEMEKTFTDCEAGAIAPLRHWKDVEVVMVAAMPGAGGIVFQAGTHEDVIGLDAHEWFGLVQPMVASFSEPEHGAGSRAFTDRNDLGAADWAGRTEAVAEQARARAACPAAARGGSTSWRRRASTRDPGPILRGRPHCARPRSSSTASSTSRAARSRGDPG